MHQFQSKSGKTINLRIPTLDDVQIMLDYINEIGKEDIYVNVNPKDLYTYKQEDFFVKDIITKVNSKRAVYYLAFDKNTLIGSCSIFKQDKRRQHIGVFGIILKKEYRNDGIGKKLAEYVINDAIHILGISLVTLDVFEPNQIAHNLYNNLGFQEYGKLPGGLSYRDDYVDSILMYRKV